MFITDLGYEKWHRTLLDFCVNLFFFINCIFNIYKAFFKVILFLI